MVVTSRVAWSRRRVGPIPTPPVNLKVFYTEYATGTLTMSRDAVDGVSVVDTNPFDPVASHQPVQAAANTGR